MTTLQQLYKEIESVEKNSNTGLMSIIDLKRRIRNYYLEKEKQQIIDAYEFGDAYYENAEDYYNDNYKK